MSRISDARGDEPFQSLLDPTTEVGAPQFAEPWHAQAFALTVGLHRQGLFSWSEWADGLSTELSRSEKEGRGDYFLCWLRALETLLISKGVTDVAELSALAQAWRTAYSTTPHGSPVNVEVSGDGP